MSPNSTLPRKRLRVSIGPDRFHQVVASVNGLPTEIDTPLFVGRVLVLVKDFDGVTPDGSPPITEHTYFHGRSRKFAILVEGRFKAREGVAPYTGEEVQFGSDFDFLPASFPHGPFNAGMRIAKFIDPATFYEETPPSGRPFIMSPYAAAYPAPEALPRAILLARHDPEHPHHEGEEAEGGLVPLEDIVNDGKRVSRPYWRFVGLLGSPPVDAFVASHSHLLPPRPSSLPVYSPRPHHPPQHRALGTIHQSLADESDSESGTPRSSSPAFSAPWGATIFTETAETPVKKRSSGRFSLATLLGGNSVLEEEYLHAGDLVTGDRLVGVQNEGEGVSAVEKQLGLWRFGEEGVDAIEDTTFIFLDPNHTRTVAQRRKHFCAEGGKHRREFRYDPDIIYTASFFTNFCDLNTFALSMGPINLNIASHFAEMPLRYTLRSTRLAPRPDGKEGPWEEEVFATIAFELVDV